MPSLAPVEFRGPHIHPVESLGSRTVRTSATTQTSGVCATTTTGPTVAWFKDSLEVA